MQDKLKQTVFYGVLVQQDSKEARVWNAGPMPCHYPRFSPSAVKMSQLLNNFWKVQHTFGQCGGTAAIPVCRDLKHSSQLTNEKREKRIHKRFSGRLGRTKWQTRWSNKGLVPHERTKMPTEQQQLVMWAWAGAKAQHHETTSECSGSERYSRKKGRTHPQQDGEKVSRGSRGCRKDDYVTGL